MNNNPMTQERLDAIQERVDDMWETDANFVAAYAREDVPALLAEVARLRALTTVDDNMVEQALRQSYGPKAWQEMCESEDDDDVALVNASREDMWDTLNAALGTGEEA